MSEKTNLLVFERKEVFLIFFFMILTAVTSFTLGIKIGKDHSFKAAGITDNVQSTVELKSTEEEEVDKLAANQELADQEFAELTNDEIKKLSPEQMKAYKEAKVRKESSEQGLYEYSNKSLEDKFDQAGKGNFNQVKPMQMQEKAMEPTQNENTLVQMEEGQGAPIATETQPANEQPNIKGKFTVQLAAHRNLNDAQKFADGFVVRNYQPIIHEVNLDGTVWYRVSLGLFNSSAEALDYVKSEKSLFDGQEYVITEIK